MLIPLGILDSGGVAVNYFLSTITGAVGTQTVPVDLAIDNDQNIYFLGNTNNSGAGGNDHLIMKLDSDGAVVWQRTIGSTSNDSSLGGIRVNNDGVYAALSIDGGTSNSDLHVVKYNHSGVLQWQRHLVDPYNLNEYAMGVALDSSGGIYAIGRALWNVAPYDREFTLFKYDNTGAIQWQRQFGGIGDEEPQGVTTDASDNVYVWGITDSTGLGGPDDFLLVKYNSAGVIQLQRELGTANRETASAIATDSSDNLYGVGRYDSGSGDRATIVKYNSTGTVQWQKELYGNDSQFNDVAISGSNAYLGGEENPSAGTDPAILVKYDLSGNVVWQRQFHDGSNDSISGIAADANAIYVNLRLLDTASSVYYPVIAKVPTDGSLTGIYTVNGYSLNYSLSSLTAGSVTMTANASSLTDLAASFTDQAGSATDAAASQTVTVTTL